MSEFEVPLLPGERELAIIDRVREIVPHSVWISWSGTFVVDQIVQKIASGRVVFVAVVEDDIQIISAMGESKLIPQLKSLAEEAKRLRESPSAGDAGHKTGN